MYDMLQTSWEQYYFFDWDTHNNLLKYYKIILKILAEN